MKTTFHLLCLGHLMTLSWGQDLNPASMNGGSVLAMAGAECVALALDKRFGVGSQVIQKIPSREYDRLYSKISHLITYLMMQMVNISPRHILIAHPHLVVAFTGFESDVQSLSVNLSVQVTSKLGRGFLTTTSNNHILDDSQQRSRISPRAMSQLTSHVLFSRRQSPYYVEPVVVGLEEVVVSSAVTSATSPERKGEPNQIDDNTATRRSQSQTYHRPFLCSQDVIGAQAQTDSFCCAGVASKSLYGTAEALWKPGMSPEELVAVCGKAFLSALERDCLSGYGARLILITKHGMEEFDLACRND